MSLRIWKTLIARPWFDFWHGLERSLGGSVTGLLRVALGLVAGWWVYVPLHELLHAVACLAAGGAVSRLEVDGLYGGGLLARLVPFVVAGSDYAGRLSGFETFGNDAIYMATVMGPFLLTIFPGVWLLRWSGARGSGLAFGFALPFALAPFLSLTGDAYEIGSILVTRLPPWQTDAALLRGDDLFLRFEALAGAPLHLWSGLALATALGALWAWLTYGVGATVSRSLRRGPVPRPLSGGSPEAEPLP